MGSLHGSYAGLQLGRHSALNTTLCPLDPSSYPNMLLFWRLLKEPAQRCEHGWATARCSHCSVGSRAYEKAHTCKGRDTGELGRKEKETYAFSRKSWGEERPVTKVETKGFPVLINL